MIESLLTLVIYLIIVGLIVWLLLWALDAIGLPEPFNKIVRALIIVVCVLIVVTLLLQVAGTNVPKITVR